VSAFAESNRPERARLDVLPRDMRSDFGAVAICRKHGYRAKENQADEKNSSHERVCLTEKRGSVEQLGGVF
jgi:hypothetical protein